MLLTHCVRGHILSFAERVEKALSVKNQIHRIGARTVPPWEILIASLWCSWVCAVRLTWHVAQCQCVHFLIWKPFNCRSCGVARFLVSGSFLDVALAGVEEVDHGFPVA